MNRFGISAILLFLAISSAGSVMAQTNPSGSTLTSTLFQNSSVLVNDGTIITNSYANRGIVNFVGGTTTNNGTITTYGEQSHGIETSGAVSIYNNGTITTYGTSNGIGAGSSGPTSLVNTGFITTSNAATVAIYDTLFITNSGSIISNSTSYSTLYLGGAGFNLTNSGTISSASDAIKAWTSGSMGTLTNTGTITEGNGYYGINYTGSINTINNSQGAGNAAGALTLYGQMPQNYNVIINSPTNYGQLAITDPTSISFNFGIDSSSTLTVGTYSDVFQGLPSTYNINGSSGSFGAFTYSLQYDASQGAANDWSLVVSASAVAPEMDGSLIPQVTLMLACLFFLMGRKKENVEPMHTV